MKTTALFIFSIILLSCNSNSEPALVQSANMVSKPVSEPYTPVVKTGLEGFYTGMFQSDEHYATDVDNKITIRIDSLKDDRIFGFSIVAGNERPFSGSFKKENNNYIVSAKEPGNDKYDGEFSFTFSPISNSLEGSWIANNPEVKGRTKHYKLEKRNFKYDPSVEIPDGIAGTPALAVDEYDGEEVETLTDDVRKINPSLTLLKSSDVANMYKSDLEVMRNSIYARHGYSFKNKKMRQLFDHYIDWYMPVSTDVTSQLTPLELKNIELLKRYEKHATKYYDSFGR